MVLRVFTDLIESRKLNSQISHARFDLWNSLCSATGVDWHFPLLKNCMVVFLSRSPFSFPNLCNRTMKRGKKNETCCSPSGSSFFLYVAKTCHGSSIVAPPKAPGLYKLGLTFDSRRTTKCCPMRECHECPALCM